MNPQYSAAPQPMNPQYSATPQPLNNGNYPTATASMIPVTTGMSSGGGGGPAPKKYIKINGVTKLNPEYRRWKESQGVPATTVASPSIALPIVSSMEDHEKLNAASIAAGGKEVPLAESTNATIEMMQEPEICMEAGMRPDEMVDQLGAVLNKYEAPMGLMNKLMLLTEFEVLEFMVDDSGSMTIVSDTVAANGRPQTRWQEAQRRLKEMMEILGHVPFNEIQICFLNRPERLSLRRNGRNPQTFLADAYRQIDQAFARGPTGSTPFLERLRESFQRFGPNRNVARYFFGDGQPNGGNPAKAEIVRLLLQRPNPEGNPMTFLSCTGDDAQVEWMKDAEEIVPFCAECDDFKDEAAEVYRDQGVALPFSFGFYLICTLVAAMNPDDLDAMDESVPFTKMTLDNLLGIEHNEESYRHYFQHFVSAQRARKVELDDFGRPKRTDQLKKNANWEACYQDFLRAPLASQIPAVQQFKRQLME
ncbi:expressed unknown protein [Seminavis robusta]|uniref:Uncharacterized protein n=1 Tax=Seminavis robusta TaxID=568900 RepID=A0A9N8DG39_9STRA|nr:expressed unknown protein [Seminavis robusta]|eukprot:Sro128_g061090.1 n/a (477) ;mRNA; r:24669-26210